MAETRGIEFPIGNQEVPMTQATAQVIIPRRNFLVRALGLTAAGATMALPIITMDDARARAEHHYRELQKALGDLYPGNTFTARHVFPEGEFADPKVLPCRPVVVMVANEPGTDELRTFSRA